MTEREEILTYLTELIERCPREQEALGLSSSRTIVSEHWLLKVKDFIERETTERKGKRTMNSTQKTDAIVHMIQSLNIAMQEAGGAIFTVTEMEHMYFMDAINKLAQNGIRFHFNKPEPEEPDEDDLTYPEPEEADE